MKLIYKGLEFSIPISGLIQVEDFSFYAGINEHATISVKVLMDEETVGEAVNSVHDGDEIIIWETEKRIFFRGKILYVDLLRETSLNYLSIQGISYTYDWELQEVSQTFCDLDASYMDVAKKVLENYPKASVIDCVTNNKKIPNFLLQYEESDWSFLKRIASHFSTFLIPDFKLEYGRVYLGLPCISSHVELTQQHYSMDKDMEKFYKLNTNNQFSAQETVRWYINTSQFLQLGEEVSINQVAAVVTKIQYKIKDESLIRSYEISRKKGVVCLQEKNPNIYGMSIPATVKERMGNCVRVHFEVDKVYEARPNLAYFPFAIESSSMYCMPEVGSVVHIYFPTHFEQYAIAVHAIRSKAAKIANNTSVGYAQNPDFKSFSNVNGAEMTLSPSGISFAADRAKETMIWLNDEGNIKIAGKDIYFHADTDITIGDGGNNEEPTKSILIRGGKRISITIAGDQLKGITLEEEANIMSSKVKMEASVKAVAARSAEEITALITVNDADTRQQINEGAKEALRYKKEKGMAEVRKGLGDAAAIIGITICAVAVIVLTAPAAPVTAPAVTATATTAITSITATQVLVGTTVIGLAFAGSDIFEGVQDYSKGMSGDLTKSFNAIRDTIFFKNQTVYDIAKSVNGIVFGVVSGQIIAGGLIKAGVLASICSNAGQVRAVVHITTNVIRGMIGDYAKYGKINMETILINAALGYLQGKVGNAIGGFFSAQLIGETTGKVAEVVIKAGVNTIIDVGLDAAVSYVTGKEFDLLESIINNTISNLIAEFTFEPIDAVSGSYFISTVDLILANIQTPIELKRQYLSRIKEVGIMGKGWSFRYDSRIYRDQNKLHLNSVTGHRILFVKEGEQWITVTKGCSRFSLTYEKMNSRFILSDVKEHTIYIYDEFGYLIAMEDQNRQGITFHYKDHMISSMNTTLGNQINFICQNGKIIQISDEIGRKIQYRYEGDLLTDVIHMDQGITHYDYNEHDYLSAVTDQNGVTYLVNTYDKDGRIVKQELPNGEIYEMDYDLVNRRNTAYYSGLDRTEVYCYNKDQLPCEIIYHDGSSVKYEYNDQQYRVQETDRRGNSKKWEYNDRGLVIKETLPDGYVKSLIYDESHNLLREWDNGGRECLFEYDANHNLIKEKRRVAQSRWQIVVHSYDSRGRVLSTKNGREETTYYSYDSNNSKPSTVITPMGEETTYEYDQVGRRVAIETSYGRVELGFNSRNYVTSQKDGEGNVSQCMYDKMGNLIAYYTPKAWQEKTPSYRYQYDFLERKIETITPLDDHYRLHRNGEGDVVKSIHPNGFSLGEEDSIGTSYEYDGDHHCIRRYHPDGGVERFFYDAEGNIVKHVMPEYYDSEMDDGIGYTYAYDARNRLTDIYNPEEEYEKAFVYDYYGNVIEEKDGTGHHLFYQYNEMGKLVEKRENASQKGDKVSYRVTLYEYDLQGNKTKERYGKEEALLDEYPISYHVISFEYDANDHLVLVKDDYGASLRYRYDCLGNPTYEERLISEGIYQRIHYKYNKSGWMVSKNEEIMGNGNCRWAVTEYAYDVNGNVIQVVTPNGHRIQREYDVCDRMVKERTIDKANRIDRMVSYAYDKAGNLLSIEESGPGVESSQVNYTYDWKNRLTHKVNPLGGTHRYLYDKNDRLLKEIQPEVYQEEVDDGAGTHYGYDSRGNLCTISNALGQITQENQYNQVNQLSARRNAMGNQLELEYTADLQMKSVSNNRSRLDQKALQVFQYNARGQIIGVEDGNQNQTTYEVDDWGRITKVISADGAEEAYAYNSGGKITEVTDANGNKVMYQYNSFGKVREIIDQEGKSEYFYYDAEQNQVLHLDRNGNRVEYSYNVDGNLVRQVAKDAKGGQVVTSVYTYNSKGQLRQAVTGGFSYQYLYTPDGRLLEKSACGRKLLQYQYNQNGQLTAIKDVTGKSSYYTYDILGRMKCVKDDRGAVIVSYRYRADDILEEVSYRNGMRTLYEYDIDGNISRLVTRTEEEIFVDFSYTYDGNGNRLKKQGVMPGITSIGQQPLDIIYTYNRKNQLIQESSHQEKIQYCYDKVGNRISKVTADGTENYLYNCKNQLVEYEGKHGKTIFTYDAQGSILKEAGMDGVIHYEYNPLNQQTKVIKPNQEVQVNVYDPEGLRAEMQENDKLIRFLFHKGEILVEMNAQEKPVSRFLRGYGVEACEQKGETYCYHKDEQLSTSMITNKDSKMENCYRYDAFGAVKESKEGIHNRITYTGQQYDGVSGQYYLRARYYNPVLGRFMQEDVYRGDGLNLYAYCNNNPVVYYDPSGYANKNTGCPGDQVAGAGDNPKGITGTGPNAGDDWLVGKDGTVNPKSKPNFGHAFETHGEGTKKTQALIGRANSNGQEQGQWLNNQDAANLLNNYGSVSEPTIIAIPDGYGQVIKPNGDITSVNTAIIIPSKNGTIKTAYPKSIE